MAKIIAKLFMVCAIGCAPYMAQAFGVSPAVVEVNNLLPTSSAATTVYFSRANPDTADTVEITVSGTGATALMLPDSTVTLPIGETSVPLTFTIQPLGLAPGDYTATMTFIYITDDSAAVDGMSIQSGVESTVQFSVTDDLVTQLAIDGIELVQPDGDPAYLQYTVMNSGNTIAGPTSVTIDYTDNTATTVATEVLPLDQLTAVPPFSSQTKTVPLNNDLGAGLYTISATFYGQDNTILLATTPLHLQLNDDAMAGVVATVDQPQPTNYWWPYLGIGLAAGCGVIIGLYCIKIKR
jgi:hypothetical protein